MSLFSRISYFVSFIILSTSSAYATTDTSPQPEQLAAKTQASQPASSSLDAEIVKLRTDWAIAKFQTPKNKQIPELERLMQRAEALYQKNPNNPEVLTWYATILSSYSSVKGGLGVLPHVKKAKALLEKAISINSRVENGFPYGVLGAIYARVPGWPIAFGSKDKARTNLQMAVQISPQGSDSNYYYGDFLVDSGNYEEAKRHLEIAQKAPVRKGYEIQDRGRKSEIAASLAKLQRLGH